jgi:hypothetical protein
MGHHCFLSRSSAKVFNQQLPHHAFQVFTGNLFHHLFAKVSILPHLAAHPDVYGFYSLIIFARLRADEANIRNLRLPHRS